MTNKAAGIACCRQYIPSALTARCLRVILRILSFFGMTTHIGEADFRRTADTADEAAGIVLALHIYRSRAVCDIRIVTTCQTADKPSGIAAIYTAVFAQYAALIHIELDIRTVRSPGLHRADEATDITLRRQLAIFCFDALNSDLMAVSKYTNQSTHCGALCVAEFAVDQLQIPNADHFCILLGGKSGKDALSTVNGGFRRKVHHAVALAVIGQKGHILNGAVTGTSIVFQIINRKTAVDSTVIFRNFRCKGILCIDLFRVCHCLVGIILYRTGRCID